MDQPTDLELDIIQMEGQVASPYPLRKSFRPVCCFLRGSLALNLKKCEVRRIEKHFEEMQKTFEYLGFDVSTEMDASTWALHKSADGTEIGSREDYFEPR